MERSDTAPPGRSGGRFGHWELREADVARAVIELPLVEHPYLVLVDGAHALIAAIPNRTARLMIGRSPEVELPIANNASTKGISRFHAVIERYSDLLTIRDSSTNGTFVNGQRVTDQRELEDRDVIGLVNVVEIFVRRPPVTLTGTVVVPTAPDWTQFPPAELRLIAALLDLWPAEQRLQLRPPPPNAALALHLGITVATVKAQFNRTFKRFDADKHSREWLGQLAAAHEPSLRVALANSS